MNIILFSPLEVQLPLARKDARARHIMETLRRGPGDTFDAGLINGPRGKGTLQAVHADTLELVFTWGESPPPLDPVHLIVGLPRPQTARDILREATTLGVATLHFVRTDRAESSYGQSSLWQSHEWREIVTTGAAQAFTTRLPEVRHGHTLAEAIASLPTGTRRVALDNYESPGALSGLVVSPGASVALALGAERGWSATERDLLRQEGFSFAHLGERVLRTETACIAALTLLKAKLGLL